MEREKENVHAKSADVFTLRGAAKSSEGKIKIKRDLKGLESRAQIK